MNENQEFNMTEIKGLKIRTEKTTTDQILNRSDDETKKMQAVIESLHKSAFPHLPEKERNIYINDYFTPGSGNFYRQVLLFMNEADRLIAVNICNCGKIEYEGGVMNGVYLISSTILPEYQSYGIGKIIGVKLLTELHPDILFTTSTQSSALHSRVGLIQKGLVSGYDVYPRLEPMHNKKVLITAPFKDMDFIISAFRQTYLALVDGPEAVEKALGNLTVFMVRKNIQAETEGVNPWEKNGREDDLAKALGVTPKDAVLVMFRRNGEDILIVS